MGAARAVGDEFTEESVAADGRVPFADPAGWAFSRRACTGRSAAAATREFQRKADGAVKVMLQP